MPRSTANISPAERIAGVLVALASVVAAEAAALDYRDVQHRRGDLGAQGPDTLERVKGQRLDAEARRVSASGTRLRDPYDLQAQLVRAALTWQVSPSLWLGLSLQEDRRHVDETLLNSRIETASASRHVAPDAAFKIMDRLILGYRYISVRNEVEGGQVSEAFYHHAALRWKGERFELSYDLAWKLGAPSAQRSGGIEARWHPSRTLTLLGRYERQDTPWSRPPLPYGDVLLTAVGGFVQLDALTLAGEYRNAQQDAADAVVHGLAVSIDYELAECASVGLAATRWLTPGGSRDDGATDGRELALRAGVRL